MRINCVFFDGEVPRSESDEYVQITNYGKGPQDLLGWVLHNEASPDRQSFLFGEGSIMGPGDTIRVYTGEVHQDWGGFSFGSWTAIWSNSRADTAVLRDSTGIVVSTRSYDPSAPPGCSS